jgi:hypothetical protein
VGIFIVPAGILIVCDQWRSSHSGRRPIPEPLWTLAAELASQHGVFRTAQVLRLDYTKLKQRTPAAAPVEKPASAPPAAFVELITPAANKYVNASSKSKDHADACASNGKAPLRRTWLGLSRVLWEPRA